LIRISTKGKLNVLTPERHSPDKSSRQNFDTPRENTCRVTLSAHAPERYKPDKSSELQCAKREQQVTTSSTERVGCITNNTTRGLDKIMAVATDMMAYRHHKIIYITRLATSDPL
jgi:hypothetical protein